MKGRQIGKEAIKLSLFEDYVIVFVENPKEQTKENFLKFITQYLPMPVPTSGLLEKLNSLTSFGYE